MQHFDAMRLYAENGSGVVEQKPLKNNGRSLKSLTSKVNCMGKFFTLAVMIMTAVSFVSCEKEEVDTNPFVGSWLYKATDFEVKCKFKSDKTFEYSEYKPSSGQGTAYTGRYTYSESSLYLEFQKQNGKEWEFNESRNYYFVDTNTLILDKWTYKKQ